MFDRLKICIGKFVADHMERHGLRVMTCEQATAMERAALGRCKCSDCEREVLNAWRDEDGHHCLTCLAKERDAVRGLVKHAWLHTAYADCGRRQMTSEQKALYDGIVSNRD